VCDATIGEWNGAIPEVLFTNRNRYASIIVRTAVSPSSKTIRGVRPGVYLIWRRKLPFTLRRMRPMLRQALGR
ncbi:MAG: hypothetical protein ACRD4Q_14515, partial [Candidatus Acidiferrales bacterium]